MSENHWAEVRAVDWARFSGAYGTEKDVAGALETLRWGTDADDDDFSDAYLDVLYGHVWHQGSIYPLTAKVLPFVFDIVDASPALAEQRGAAARDEIVDLVMHCSAAARRAGESADADERANGAAVMSALLAELPRLEVWKASDAQRRSAIVTMLNLPTLRDHVLACHEHERRELLDIVLSSTHVVGVPVLEWAARELATIDHPVTARAAKELREAAARGTFVDQDRFAALACGLPNGLDPLRERLGIAAPNRSLARAGESHGVVRTSDRDWFVVFAGEGRHVTVRWANHPFAEGDAVVLTDLGTRNIPRSVRGTNDKAASVASFDESGRLVERGPIAP